MDRTSKVFKAECRSYMELRTLVKGVMKDWDIHDYFVSIAGNGSCLYPDKHVLTVCPEQLIWPEPAVMSSILHEIGHINRGHYLGQHDDCLLNHVDEYEADEFAFDAVRERYGYVPDSAGLWLLNRYGEEIWSMDLFTHPSYEHRWENLARNGFLPEDYHPTLRALGLGKVKHEQFRPDYIQQQTG